MATTKNSEDVLKDNPLFKMGPPLIQTYEDAQMAFLREQISEEELRAAAGKFGRVAHTYVGPAGLERPDEAFHRSFPEDLQEEPEYQRLEIDERLDQAEAKAEVREAAEKAADKITAKAEPVSDLGELQNEAAKDAAEKKEKQVEDKLFPNAVDDPKTGANKK